MKRTRVLYGLGIVLSLLIAGYIAVRPVHLRWGATAEEVARAMPGDLDGMRWTRAITIAATPQQVWPWLMQWGQGRGGWYSYDWLENLLGFDIHTADRIVPEYQNMALGDKLCMARGFCPMDTVTIEPYRWLGWQAKNEQGKPVWTFIFGLFPLDATHTRLVVRESFDKVLLPPAAGIALEIPDVVMEQKALTTVRNRVEGRIESAWTTAFEIIAWLAAFVAGVIAGVLFVIRKDWRAPLAVGAASVIVLLALTFLFPPLWLRGVLDIILLAGLAWTFRQAAQAIPFRIPPEGLSHGKPDPAS